MRLSEWRTMPQVLFFDTRNVFEPERIQKLASVFKDVLGSISDSDFAALPALTIRRLVATSLMEEARRGVLDPERLKAAALAALSTSLGSGHVPQSGIPSGRGAISAAASGR
jgi:hypothetical protein